jgi:hypothetical protein
MATVTEAASGVIMDDYLYTCHLRDDFRWDAHDAHYEDYVPVRVADSVKSFDADAWLRVPGCKPERLISLLAPETLR